MKVGQKKSEIVSRVGQSVFARNIKKLYGHKCCFPYCDVSDRRYLIAAHIARWSDNEVLRGHLGNGLCLCLMHDKAFELGVFTLNSKYEVVLKPDHMAIHSSFRLNLIAAQGSVIKTARINPLKKSLSEHWRRIKFYPN